MTGFSLPVITDPWFYAVALPAVLVMGLSKSGFLGGFGALVVPMLALVVPVPQAAAIMLPLLLVMDATGLQQLWRRWDADLMKLLLPAGLLGCLLGALTFGLLPQRWVAGVVGALTLLFLAQRLLFPPRAGQRPASRRLGFVLGVVGGYSSFVAHAGGPPINAYALPLRLEPLRYMATMAMVFAVINLSKWVPYAWLGLIDLRNMATSLVLLPLAPVGVWLGVWLTRRIRPAWFYRVAYTGMGLAGVKLLFDAWR